LSYDRAGSAVSDWTRHFRRWRSGAPDEGRLSSGTACADLRIRGAPPPGSRPDQLLAIGDVHRDFHAKPEINRFRSFPAHSFASWFGGQPAAAGTGVCCPAVRSAESGTSSKWPHDFLEARRKPPYGPPRLTRPADETAHPPQPGTDRPHRRVCGGADRRRAARYALIDQGGD